jgi:hypothetical protein
MTVDKQVQSEVRTAPLQHGADARPARVAPSDVRYIKLGVGGVYERVCIKQNVLRLDFHFVPHGAALTGDIDTMLTHAQRYRDKAGMDRDDVRQVRDFYELGEDVLWITMVDGRLYWCFAEAGVEWIHPNSRNQEHGHRIRRCKTPWRGDTLDGAPLLTSSLHGALTKVEAYRKSICAVSEKDYLLRKINGEPLPEIEHAMALRKELACSITALMRMLDPRDFELLVELVFANSGWRRQGAVGGTQKTVDLELMLPSTGERGFVQVKSQTFQSELDDYVDHFQHRDEDKMFFIYHSAATVLSTDEPGCILIGPERLAEMIMDTGLFGWLIEKAG